MNPITIWPEAPLASVLTVPEQSDDFSFALRSAYYPMSMLSGSPMKAKRFYKVVFPPDILFDVGLEREGDKIPWMVVYVGVCVASMENMKIYLPPSSEWRKKHSREIDAFVRAIAPFADMLDEHLTLRAHLGSSMPGNIACASLRNIWREVMCIVNVPGSTRFHFKLILRNWPRIQSCKRTVM